MPDNFSQRIEALRRRYRQDNNLDPIYAVVGKVTSAGNYLYDTSVPGNVFVRVLTSNGLGDAISVRGPEQNMTLYIGLNVKLLRDSRDQLYISGVDNQAQFAGGANPYITSQPPQSRVRQDFIETLSVLPDSPPSLYLNIKSWNPIVNGTYYEFPGTRVYMGPYVPATGSMQYASLFLKTDYLTGEVHTSTARATSDLPLDHTDVQETVNLRSSGAIPVQAIKLIGGQGTISLTDIQNDGKPIQQLVNVADSGGTSDTAQNPGLAKMGPVNGPVPGSAATPTYRSIQPYDLPDRFFAAYNYQVADGVYRIGLAKSSDGRSFRRVTQPIIDIGAGGSWEASGVFQPTIIDVNGVYYCYYIGYDGTYKKIGLSRSFDGGATWTKYASNPVLSANGTGWETTGSAQHLQTPFVMYDPDDSDSTQRFKLWYAGGLYGSGGIGYAYSSDGLSWTKYASNPVLTPGTVGAFDDTYMAASAVVRVGTTYYLFYGGDHPVSSVDHWKVGRATFTNPKSSYTKSGSNPILAGDALSTTITASVSVGATSIAVTSSAGFAVGMPVWLSDATNHYLSTITSIPDSTHIVCADTAPVGLSSSPVIRSANYNSITFNSAYYDGGWKFYGTAFQPGFDNSHSYEIGFAAYAYADLTDVRFDYEAGMIIPTLTSESTGTGVSHENPAVLDLAPWYRRHLGKPLGGGTGSSPLTTKGDLYTYSTLDARLPVGSNGQLLSVDSGQATGLSWVNATGTLTYYPKRATMWHDEAIITAGNALNIVHDASQNYGVWSDQNAPSASDKFTNSFMLRAGTFTFTVLGIKGNNYGKLDWYIDGRSVVTGEDWYAGSTTYNVMQSHSSIVVATDGYHTLEGRINGKNGSSSDYYALLTKYWFTPASD